MAAKRRHWKEKDGRFWARVAIPAALRPFFGNKTQLTEPLGGDRRVADRNHPAAVARLQAQIEQARRAFEGAQALTEPVSRLRQVTSDDHEHAVWNHYTGVLEAHEQRRAGMPTPSEISAAYELVMQRIEAGEADPQRNPVAMFNVYTDHALLAGARHFDEQNRRRRLSALRSSLAAGETRFIDPATAAYVAQHQLAIEKGSAEWRELAEILARAEIEALERTLERDKGNYGNGPSDPIVRRPRETSKPGQPVLLTGLFRDYITNRQAIGKHRDGGAPWEHVFQDLVRFLGHDDARRITKRNLLDWRDSLLAAGKSPKTIADKYLAAIRAVLRWAFDNDRLPTNEAEAVKQDVPRKVRAREAGFTTPEAIQILTASLSYQPKETRNPSNRESAHLTAAKQWVPLLCAFTGARITEMTQLRSEDLREEDGRWILRITPDAGSVKTGEFRDVPLHRQVVELGFIDFVKSAKPGPMFHGAKSPEKYLANARVTAGRLSEWLHSLDLVPSGVQPNYGWRHRFKTLGREMGMSDRVLDAIQGHAGKTAGDSYGDVTIAAKLRMIDGLPEYPIHR